MSSLWVGFLLTLAVYAGVALLLIGVDQFVKYWLEWRGWR